jgi:hypothetical protein
MTEVNLDQDPRRRFADDDFGGKISEDVTGSSANTSGAAKPKPELKSEPDTGQRKPILQPEVGQSSSGLICDAGDAKLSLDTDKVLML